MRGLAQHEGARNFEDDAAVIPVGGITLVVTMDMMAEGVHFLPDQDPADVAWKLVATNMSDLAAKGADPLWVMLGYSLGENDERFIEGLREALTCYEATLIGGDTIRTAGPGTHSLAAFGRATHEPAPSRAGAKVGDDLWLSGPVGGAMMGFEALQAGKGDSLAYRRPTALVGLGMVLAPHVTAMMDVSDGLLLDASRMAQASGVTLAIDRDAVPIAAPEQRRDDALRWGDDYQLLFTLPPQAVPPVDAFRIGAARPAGDHAILVDTLPPSDEHRLGYQHGQKSGR